ncbi:MAG: glycosyltransferase family 4 protein [Patescibacteria group bacterium]
MTKLCYILPEYDPRSHTHFAYLPGFIREISKDFAVFLVIEKGERPPDDWGCRRIWVARFSFPPVKWCELHCRLLYARLWGCRDFYVHYSFGSAFLASTIVKVCGGRVFYWNCGLPWQYRRGFLRETFERLTYRLISFLVTGTEELKKQYAAHYRLSPEKIKVMPNWIDLREVENRRAAFGGAAQLRGELAVRAGQKVVLFAHRLSRRKGAHYLPEILDKLRDENAVLLIAGDGPEGESVKAEMENRGLKDFARFLGWVPNSELAGYYSLADVFIMPSEEEGFPRVLLEAMAFGVPFVAFDAGSAREIIPPALGDFVVPAGDVAVFAGRIAEVLKKDAAEIRAVEKEWVKKFDLSVAADRFKTLFL